VRTDSSLWTIRDGGARRKTPARGPFRVAGRLAKIAPRTEIELRILRAPQQRTREVHLRRVRLTLNR